MIKLSSGVGWVLCMKIQHRINSTSLFSRNLQELGVDSIETLKYLFPSKTDDEIAGMLWFPIPCGRGSTEAYSAFIDLINQMQTPHPQQPNLPMAADPGSIYPYLYRTLENTKRVTYAGRYRNAGQSAQVSRPNRPATRHRHRRRPNSGGFDQSAMGGTLCR